MTSIRLLFLLTLAITLSACDNGGSDNPTSVPSTSSGAHTNISVITGTQLGSNSATISQVRKNITFSLDNPHSDFAFGSAYAAQTTTSSSAIYWIVEVSNTGDQTHCFIRMNTGRYLASDNAELGTEDFTYVNGSLKELTASGIHTNTCLESGESGHFIGIDSTISMDQVSGIAFSTLSVSSSQGQAPGLTMGAVSYSADSPSNFVQGIDLTVQNFGPAAGIVGSLSLSVLLDDNDNPLIWLYFSRPTGWSGELASGQSGIIQDDLIYDGVSNKLRVYLDFEAQTVAPLLFSASSLQPTLNEEDFSTTEEYLSYVLDTKNQNENLKQLSQ